jgi:DNA-binding GntR family transcriptional regulator
MLHGVYIRPVATRVSPPPSLSGHVLEVLREDILSGRIEPGTRLTEAAVIERTGVSRTPAREGLRRLEAEGLVTTHRGRSAFVTYRLSSQEARLIYECRLVLEPYLTRVAAERMTAEDLETLVGITTEFAALSQVEPAVAGRLDAEFHLTIYEASRSQLTSVLRGYWSRLQLELSERVYKREVPARFAAEHTAIQEALAARDGARAGELMHDHIKHGQAVMKDALDAASTGAT